VLVAGSVGSLSDIVGQLLRGAGASERLMELLETEPAIKPPRDPSPCPSRCRPGTGRGLGFSYPARPGTRRWRRWTWTSPRRAGGAGGAVRRRQVDAVPPAAALLRPAAGRLTLDGVDLRALDPAELRRHIAVVPQDPVIFGADAWENIRYGTEGADDEQVRPPPAPPMPMPSSSGCPEGYDTFLGERGVRLSGGERQRIAVARAILRDLS
jgi:ATP-binding cassette subfamily B protein